MAPPQRYPLLYDVAWLSVRAEAGRGLSDVAREVGCSVSAVLRAARRTGVEFTQRAAPRWQPGTCERCGATFDKGSGAQRFCSVVCRADMGDGTSECEQCGNRFTESLTGAKAKRMRGRRFCSRRCRNLYLYGKEAARSITPQGYVRITTPDGRMSMMEHRYVMECVLNRRLRKGETVHHKDDNRANNDPSNLQLRQGNHGPGAVFRCRSCGSHDVEAVEL